LYPLGPLPRVAIPPPGPPRRSRPAATPTLSNPHALCDRVHLFSVTEDLTVAEVASRMAEWRVGAVLVLAAGRLRGVFSERDLMLRVVLQRRDPDRTCVREVMSTNLATIDESAGLEEAMENMTACNCRHLPVMSGWRVVGFLSMRDVMHHELARKNDELRHMRAYIQGEA
jgi:signal-transduction protein with cAMP-binding, CBS, and nucleotidyltransferase domain